jgi:hypothetical protein
MPEIGYALRLFCSEAHATLNLATSSLSYSARFRSHSPSGGPSENPACFTEEAVLALVIRIIVNRS